MPKPKPTIDAQRVGFLAPLGSKKFYREIAALEGIGVDTWIRAVLRDAAIKVLEAHGRDTSHVPPLHVQRPPRLQPPYGEPDDGGTS